MNPNMFSFGKRDFFSSDKYQCLTENFGKKVQTGRRAPIPVLFVVAILQLNCVVFFPSILEY